MAKWLNFALIAEKMAKIIRVHYFVTFSMLFPLPVQLITNCGFVSAYWRYVLTWFQPKYLSIAPFVQMAMLMSFTFYCMQYPNLSKLKSGCKQCPLCSSN